MSGIVILGDTNVAYNLYFFISYKVIQPSQININGDSFLFHPVVLEEVLAHADAWIIAKELGIKPSRDIPGFFNKIKQEGILKICTFVEDNVANISEVDTDTTSFNTSRKAYESVRKRIQTQMISEGVVANKATSQPSLNDYKILYSAQIYNYKLSTNDGILLEISKDILDEHNAINTEKLLNMILQSDFSKREGIEEGLKDLNSHGRKLNQFQIFN